MDMQEKVEQMARDWFDPDGHLDYDLMERSPSWTCGSFRSVVLDHKNGVVFKLSQHPRYEDNQREWDLYFKVSPEVQATMAKPLAISSCGKVLAMELIPDTVYSRFYPREELSPGIALQKRTEMSNMLKTFDTDLGAALRRSRVPEKKIRFLLEDNHAANVGVREDGTLVWIDYAGCV